MLWIDREVLISSYLSRESSWLQRFKHQIMQLNVTMKLYRIMKQAAREVVSWARLLEASLLYDQCWPTWLLLDNVVSVVCSTLTTLQRISQPPYCAILMIQNHPYNPLDTYIVLFYIMPSQHVLTLICHKAYKQGYCCLIQPYTSATVGYSWY